MNLRLLKPVAAVLVLTLSTFQPGVYAAMIPSKTATNQEIASRATDVELARHTFATDRIANALAVEGLTLDQIDTRLRALSTADLTLLSENPAQIKSAGVTMTRKTWTIVGIAVGAVVIGAAALKSDDSDDSDDGED